MSFWQVESSTLTKHCRWVWLTEFARQGKHMGAQCTWPKNSLPIHKSVLERTEPQPTTPPSLPRALSSLWSMRVTRAFGSSTRYYMTLHFRSQVRLIFRRSTFLKKIQESIKGAKKFVSGLGKHGKFNVSPVAEPQEWQTELEHMKKELAETKKDKHEK